MLIVYNVDLLHHHSNETNNNLEELASTQSSAHRSEAKIH